MSASLPSEGWIVERVERLTGRRLSSPPVLTDTTDFMAIDRDMVVLLGGEAYLVTGTEREKRFGLVDEPKFWVKRALSLATGRRHVLKLVFREQFRVQVGDLSILCTRSAEKEGRVLELVGDDPRFMHGRAVPDARGNLVRILDFITGTDLLEHLGRMAGSHEEYFGAVFPGVLARVVESFTAIQRLHESGLCHGDIRNDHLLLDTAGGAWRWIDFDLAQDSHAYDVWTLGNVLHCAVARGFVTFRDVLERSPELAGRLSDEDASVFFPFRVMNLRAIYPYVPRSLNEILLRFAVGGRTRYDSARQIAEDLGAVLALLPRAAPQER